MKTKALNNVQQEELKNMILQGKLPSELKEIFGVSISTIHNYKKELKKRGLQFPNLKGKRSSNLKNNEIRKESDNIKVMEIFLEKSANNGYFLKISIGENYYKANVTDLLK